MPIADDLPMYCVKFMHEKKSHGLQWVESVGVANKNAAFAMLMSLAKRFEA